LLVAEHTACTWDAGFATQTPFSGSPSFEHTNALAPFGIEPKMASMKPALLTILALPLQSAPLPDCFDGKVVSVFIAATDSAASVIFLYSIQRVSHEMRPLLGREKKVLASEHKKPKPFVRKYP
jgi:hypothetical protein